MKKLFVLAAMIFTLLINSCTTEVTKEIIWSDSVEVLGLAAFYNCSSLNNLILPSSLKEIHVNVADAGYVKDYLSKLSYEGTIEEFKNISIIGNYLSGTRIYCSDGNFVYGEE